MRSYGACGQERLCQLAGLARGEAPVRHGAREHATDVGIQYGDALAKGKGRDGIRGVLTHAGQSAKGGDVGGHLATVFVTDNARRVVQGLGSTVVSQARPETDHVRERGVRARTRIREGLKEPPPGLEHPRDLGLLEHDLAHEHRPGVIDPDPRQGTP